MVTRAATLTVLLAIILPHVFGKCTEQRPKGEKVLGDWKDMSKSKGWTVFNSNYQPFDPAVNLKFCGTRTITIALDKLTTDYTNSINNAFKQLNEMTPKGGTVKLNAGVYIIGGQIAMGSYSCLIGAGMRQTILRLKNNAKTFPYAGMVRSMWTERVTLKDITIDGNMARQKAKTVADLKKGKSGYGRYGLFTELTNYVYMKRVSVINHLGYGFDPHGSKREWAYYLLLENCEAKNNGLDGFTLDQTLYVALRNSVGTDNHRHGVNIVTGTRYIVVVGNYMERNGFKSGVGCNMMAQNNQCFGTRHIRFIRNTLVNARKGGHCFNDVHNVSVQRSRISNTFVKSFCYYMDATSKLRIRTTTCQASRGGKGTTRALRGAKFEFVDGQVGLTALNRRKLTPVTA